MYTNLTNLYKHIESNDSLIVGSPKGVGFTTTMCEIVAQKMYFEESFSIIYLTSTRSEKMSAHFKIQKAYTYYDKNGLEVDNFILYEPKENGSAVSVMNYDEIDITSFPLEHYNWVVVDRDDFSDNLYEGFGILHKISDKIIFNTYDLPHSIFYNLDLPKIVLRSKYAITQIRQPEDKINGDRIKLGKFNERKI